MQQDRLKRRGSAQILKQEGTTAKKVRQLPKIVEALWKQLKDRVTAESRP